MDEHWWSVILKTKTAVSPVYYYGEKIRCFFDVDEKQS